LRRGAGTELRGVGVLPKLDAPPLSYPQRNDKHSLVVFEMLVGVEFP
jgi:hypothetical protein